MIGYMSNNDTTLEEGKTYSIINNFNENQLSTFGFNFVKDKKYILEYSQYDKDMTLFEVEVLGKITSSNDEIFYTDKIRVINKIELNNFNAFFNGLCKLDDNFNMIYKEYSIRKEYFIYDDNNNILESYYLIDGCRYDSALYRYENDMVSYRRLYEYRSSDIYNERYYFYDEDGNLSRVADEDSDNYLELLFYNKDNKLVFSKNNNGFISLSIYDEKGNLSVQDCGGVICRYDYDINNNIIHYRQDNGSRHECFKEYDTNKNIIHYLLYAGPKKIKEVWKRFDTKNNVVYYKDDSDIEFSVIVS